MKYNVLYLVKKKYLSSWKHSTIQKDNFVTFYTVGRWKAMRREGTSAYSSSKPMCTHAHMHTQSNYCTHNRTDSTDGSFDMLPCLSSGYYRALSSEETSPFLPSPALGAHWWPHPLSGPGSPQGGWTPINYQTTYRLIIEFLTVQYMIIIK